MWELCEICCVGVPASCSDEELHCPILPISEFKILETLGTLILLFVFGNLICFFDV